MLLLESLVSFFLSFLFLFPLLTILFTNRLSKRPKQRINCRLGLFFIPSHPHLQPQPSSHLNGLDYHRNVSSRSSSKGLDMRRRYAFFLKKKENTLLMTMDRPCISTNGNNNRGARDASASWASDMYVFFSSFFFHILLTIFILV